LCLYVDIDARMTRFEEKLDALSEQLTGYHEEVLRNYYTKPEVNARLSPLPGMMTEITRLNERGKRYDDALLSKSHNPNNYHTRIMAVQIILILVLIVAQLLGVKITNVF